MVKLMVEAFSRLQRVTFLKVNGKKIKPQVWEFLSKRMVRVCSKGISEMMLRMEEALSYGVMAATTMESIEMARSMERESTTGQMDQNMVVSGNRMKCMVQVSSYGPMVVSIRVSST